MNSQNTAGIDLDELTQRVEGIAQWLARAGKGNDAFDLHALINLARRAEPSVAADERALFETWYREDNPGAAPRGYSENLSKNDEGQYFIYPVPKLWAAWQARAALASPAVSRQAADERASYMRAIDSMYPIPNNPHQSVVQRSMDARIAFTHGWDAARAALASPAVSQKDGAAVIPRYKLVPGKDREWMSHAEDGAWCRWDHVAPYLASTAATTSSASDGAIYEAVSRRAEPSVAAVNTDGLLAELDWCIMRGVASPGMRTHAALVKARAALARAPLPGQGDGKKCQYPNCGCTSRATCNFNYDAPAQAGDARDATVLPSWVLSGLREITASAKSAGHAYIKMLAEDMLAQRPAPRVASADERSDAASQVHPDSTLPSMKNVPICMGMDCVCGGDCPAIKTNTDAAN
jgi:hypothetical protein